MKKQVCECVPNRVHGVIFEVVYIGDESKGGLKKLLARIFSRKAKKWPQHCPMITAWRSK